MSIDFSMKECGGIRLFSIGPLSKGATISQLISNDSSTFQTILRAGRPVFFVSRAEPSTSQLAASSVCTLPHAINDSHAPPLRNTPSPHVLGGVWPKSKSTIDPAQRHTRRCNSPIANKSIHLALPFLCVKNIQFYCR